MDTYSFFNNGTSKPSSHDIAHDDPKLSLDNAEQGKSPSQHRRMSQWQRLKHRLNSLTDEDEIPMPSYSTTVLPDDVEYIEGGDIVPAEHAHDVETSTSGLETNSEHHHQALSTVQEERTDDAVSSRKTSNENMNASTFNNDSLTPVSENAKL